MTPESKSSKLGNMDSFLPIIEGPLRRAYPVGTYDHPGLSSTFSSRELLLREHLLTCLYWFPGQNPLRENLFQRVNDVLPTGPGRHAYLENYRSWGRQMAQARLEGLAIEKVANDYIMPNELVVPPAFFYPTVASTFIAEQYMPGAVLALPKEHWRDSMGLGQPLYDRASVRAREAICLMGIYLEYAQHLQMVEYSCLLDRMIHTLIALNPILRLGMPGLFGDFVRRSIVAMAQYFFGQKETMLACLSGIPPAFYDDLAECSAELANLMMQIGPYRAPEKDDFLGAT
jgi:hypothetical protein